MQILHDKLGLLPLIAQVDTHESVASADIDKGALLGIHVGQIVVVDKVAHLVSLATSQAGHGAAHALGARGILAKGDEHGLLVDRVEGKVEAGTCQLGALGIGPQRLERVGGSREDVLGVEAHPGLQRAVLGEHAGGGGVGDEAGRGLLEDVVGHGMAESTSEVDGIQRSLGLELGKRNGRIDRDELG